MPNREEHCERSKELFGEDGAEYHRWIDQYASYGYRHRQVLHNKEGVEVGVQLFGEQARKHLERHIRDDYRDDKIPAARQLRSFPRATDGLIKKDDPKFERLKSEYIETTNED